MAVDKYEMLNQKRKQMDAKKRIAAYCRVSTDHEDQADSFESQQRYFRQYIEARPDWELYEVFADRKAMYRIQKMQKGLENGKKCDHHTGYEKKEYQRFCRQLEKTQSCRLCPSQHGPRGAAEQL